MPVDFTALDFETANGFIGSPCAVGLVRVRNAQVMDRWYSLMRPPGSVDLFDPRNSSIHGISAEQVAAAPTFEQCLMWILAFIGTDVVVAHNSGFDTAVLRHAAQAAGLELPALSHLCSVKISRRTYVQFSHALPAAARAAGFTLAGHHDPAADARASAAIVIDAARQHQADSLAHLARLIGLPVVETEAYLPGRNDVGISTSEAIAAVERSHLPAQPAWAG